MFKTYSKIALLLLFSMQISAQTTQKGSLELKTKDTVLSVGGRAELLMRYSAPTSKNIAKSILASDPNEKQHLNYDVTGSRLWVKTKTPSKYGMIRTLVEIDFQGTPGTQATVNSSNPRLRHVYARVGNWTIGQTNSAFNSFVALDILELPINDMFVRQPLIRYTIDKSSLQYDISFEQPETTLRDENGTMLTPADDILPDLVLRTRYYSHLGNIGLSFLGRYINQEVIKQESAFAWATNFSAKINIGLDDIRLAASYGLGMGRYISYNSYAAGYLDTKGHITLQPSFGGHFGYRHWWKDDLRSTLAIAFSATQNNSNVKELDTNTKEAYTSTANLFWTPVLNSLVGFEYTNTKLKAQSNLKSDFKALNFCFRYEF